jgi:hypothetical protein
MLLITGISEIEWISDVVCQIKKGLAHQLQVLFFFYRYLKLPQNGL